ncbi:MAG: response regulator [Candidatus Deferrimicrobium sp.]
MPKKLLLAEDSLTIRKVFGLALSRSDIAITAVDNGEDAVRLAAEILPDLVVADVTLPGKDGFAVSAELRGMEKTGKIPVLILSGTLVPLDEARLKASGARGVLFKPFESRELVESIERLLREGAAGPESRKTEEAPPADERWDFSDVMEEVEAESGKAAASAPPAGEVLLPGAILPGGTGPTPAFNEFDVSVDEIEEGAREFPAETPPPAPIRNVEHIEPGFPMDSPPPVTDLSPALDEVEEIGEIENLEEVEAPMPPAGDVLPESPASLRILPVAAAETVDWEPVTAVDEPIPTPPSAQEPVVGEPAVAEHAVEESSSPPPAPLAAPADAGSRPTDAELRDLFTGRAEEIFRTVASEAVEKVMWEMTDRLTAEFSAKIRESVEAIAWEVIPSTAEALIREEIARIRGQAGKPSP